MRYATRGDHPAVARGAPMKCAESDSCSVSLMAAMPVKANRTLIWPNARARSIKGAREQADLQQLERRAGIRTRIEANAVDRVADMEHDGLRSRARPHEDRAVVSDALEPFVGARPEHLQQHEIEARMREHEAGAHAADRHAHGQAVDRVRIAAFGTSDAA